jgi:hypothetical protein
LVIGVITLFFIFVYASMVSAALQSIINRQWTIIWNLSHNNNRKERDFILWIRCKIKYS